MNTETKIFAAKQLQAPHESAPCEFKVGDKVTYTNPQGVVCPGHVVIGFCKPFYNSGGSVHLDLDCYWFPVKPENLKLEST